MTSTEKKKEYNKTRRTMKETFNCKTDIFLALFRSNYGRFKLIISIKYLFFFLFTINPFIIHSVSQFSVNKRLILLE